jgi:hypothetical protein
VSGVKWVLPGRALVTDDVRERDVPGIVAQATSVQFERPLPTKIMWALAAAMRDHPEVALYVYGHRGSGPIDSGLAFLDGFEHVRSLSLALDELEGFDGLERFSELRKLQLAHRKKRSVAVLRELTQLQDLSVSVPGADMSIVASLDRLEILNMTAARGALVPLTDHPTLQRLTLHYGTERDLAPLATCRQLRALAANGSPVRFLELEQLPALSTFAPLAELPQLEACTLFDTRPNDRSLAPLVAAPRLAEVFIGGNKPFPKTEVDALATAFAGRRFRYRELHAGPEDVPRLSWRGLLGYADKTRTQAAA